MVECDRQDLVCLHLAAHDDARGRSPAPRAVTVTGIGDALEVGTTTVGRFKLLDDLASLRDAGLVTAEERPVSGYDAPRTVYFPTEAGRERARAVRERVADRTVVVTNGTSDEVPLGEVGRYFEDHDAPLVTALARLTDDGRVPLEHHVSDEFVDRHDALETVMTAISEGFQHEVGTVLVGGPAGMGKTALVEEAVDRVADDHAPVVARGTCRAGPTTPYGPVRQAFEAAPGERALVALLDEARETSTPTEPDDVDARRTALFDDIADLLRDASAERPVVVFLDNLQWADRATLALFEHLATTVTEWIYPVAFVDTYRTPAVAGGDHPFAAVRDRLEAAGSLTEVTLEPLDETATRALLEGEIGSRQVPAAFVELVHDRTGGVPLFVRETARHLLDREAVDPATGTYPTRPEAVSLPAAVTESLGERLTGLDETGRELVGLAAVVGVSVPGPVLAAASDLPPIERREYVDLLVESRVLERPREGTGGDGAGRPGASDVRFVSGGVREAIVDRLPDGRAAEYHERVGEAFVEVSDGDERAARIAYHFERAGDDERAVAYYRRAGDHATGSYANEVAVANYRQALALGEDAVGDAELATIVGDLADVHRRTGEYDSALDTVEEGLALAPYESQERCRLLGIATDVHVARGAYDTARETSERQRDLAAAVGATDLEAAALDRLGEVAWKRGQYDRAREDLERSRSLYREAGDRTGEASSLNNLGTVALEQGDYDAAREHYERSIAIRRDLDEREGIASSVHNLGAVAYEQGDYDAAREYFERSVDIERDLGNRRGEALSLHNLGAVATEQGDYDAAREYYEECLATFRDLDDRNGQATTLSNLGEVARERGEYDEAHEYYERTLAIRRDLDDREGEARGHKNLGVVTRERGDHDRALEHLDSALETFETMDKRDGVAEVAVELGRLELDRDAVDEARELARGAHDTFEELGRTHWKGRSRLLLGRVAAADGEPDRAREHWRAALETFEAVDAPQDALATLERLVGTCREHGDTDRAREWLRRARDLLSAAPEATAAQHREWVERQAADLDGPSL